MRKVTIKLTLLCVMLLSISSRLKSQAVFSVPVNYVFSADSLSGFDEDAAEQGAFDVEAYGDEFKVYMYAAKREYINKKYNITPVYPSPVKEVYNKTIPYPNINSKPGNPVIAAATCTNEDFEEGSLSSPVPGTITVASTGAVNGWLCQGASNSSGGANGNCLNAYAYGNPNPIKVIAPGAAGLTDAIIGSGYKIYSVYGNTATTYPGSAAQDPFNHYGDWFIKLNDQTAGSSVNKISKTFAVTSSNALFQFAFISVLEGSHGCCDGGGFALKVKIASPCTAAPVTTTCPQFTAAVQPGCTSSGNTTTYLTSTVNPNWKYNTWKQNTLDLTSYIGSCITIEVTAFDCTYTGHAGYVYFDAQCSPMDIVGNTNTYPAGTASINLPTCGSGNTATITAPPVTGGYTWTCPGPYTVAPGSGGQTIYTGITGNHTLTMNPPGSCSPIIRVINVIISPAPNLAITSPTMYSCSNPTLNGAGVQMGSGTPNSATTPNYTVAWQPALPTGTVGTTATTGTFTGLAVGVNTITITDSAGCVATQTLNVTPPPSVPSFSISAPDGTVIGCNPPSIQLIAVNTNTALSNTTYTWTSITTGALTGSTINATAPGGSNIYTISAQDASVGSCITTLTFAVSSNTAIPSVTVNPITQTLTCNGACKTFTAITTTTTNIVGTWYDQSNIPLSGPSGTPLLLCANAPGIYTASFCNVINGCCNSQTVAVAANTIIPTITITPVSSNGFTINCTHPNVQMVISSSGTLAPTGYTWTNLSTNATVSPVSGGFTTTIPGQYEAAFHDGNFCTVTTTVTVYIDTLRPSPMSMTNLPSNSYTLNCFTPTLTATALTNPLLPITSYSWTTPPNLIVSSNTIGISLINITSSTSPTSYTVLAMGANGCVGKAKVNFYKDIYVPPYSVVFTPSAITCANPCIALTGSSSSTVPVTYTFTSPVPTQTANTAGALMCSSGTYTMTYMSALNGCTNVATNSVALNVTPPGTVALSPITLPCGQTTTIISAGTTTTSPTYSYTWEGPPLSGMSCPGGVGCNTTQVNAPGIYGVTILNTVNGCIATNSVLVNSGTVSASFNTDPTSGYAPLAVNFDNTSNLGSLTNGTVTTIWNYGNGITYTVSGSSASYSTSGYPDGNAMYQATGSYTVWMIITQNTGTASCVGTASAVVNVDLPSDLTVPNVFTPNGDGVNDNFTLLTTNLTNITCQIYDRWGTKMYDVTADKGNISWDGKNFSNKDVPAGTYFYILKATGKDFKEFEQKGTISLYR